MYFTEERLKDAVSREPLSIDRARELMAGGEAVLLANRLRKGLERPCLIGKGMTVKVNANIGFSSGHSSIENEIDKMNVAVDAGTDTVMDLSTGENLNEMRRKVLERCAVPVGTVPVYQLACRTDISFSDIREEDFIGVVAEQAREGVDFFTIHAGLTLEAAESLASSERIIQVVSRGGALLVKWMLHNKRENPFLTRFQELLDIAKEYNIVLSLGDSLRPGAVADATDNLQINELSLLGVLQRRAFKEGVQVIIEGPGHVPLNQVIANVELEKRLCHGAPFYVLGPLVTDAACGWDHIAGAIGGAVAAMAGADYLCYVTAAEHVSLPDINDVREGVIASRIAAHAADIARGVPSAVKKDRDISFARAKRDWKRQFELSLDPVKAASVRRSSIADESDQCAMCSDLCSMKMVETELSRRSVD